MLPAVVGVCQRTLGTLERRRASSIMGPRPTIVIETRD